MAVRLVTLAFNSGRQEDMVAFYRSLGAELRAKQVSKGGHSYQGNLGNLEITIYSFARREAVAAPNFSMRLEVDEIDSTMERVRSCAGVQVVMDIEMMPDGKKAIVLDPDGHSVEIVEAWTTEG